MRHSQRRCWADKEVSCWMRRASEISSGGTARPCWQMRRAWRVIAEAASDRHWVGEGRRGWVIQWLEGGGGGGMGRGGEGRRRWRSAAVPRGVRCTKPQKTRYRRHGQTPRQAAEGSQRRLHLTGNMLDPSPRFFGLWGCGWCWWRRESVLEARELRGGLRRRCGWQDR